MANCVTCKARCEYAGQHRVKTDCISYMPKDYPKPQTNYDLLISKTPEELAEFMIGVAQRGGIPLGGKPMRWLDWLKSSVEVDE